MPEQTREVLHTGACYGFVAFCLLLSLRFVLPGPSHDGADYWFGIGCTWSFACCYQGGGESQEASAG